ncbi:ATP synthase subunit f, mitochondrial [Rhineura floridana]|uniref:ATP synthase subunit f, mitochondrial n=1 Tax=Rhineura floridana TaxID=261503 RepID=UPI002AC84E13|nr:ATP synthase subunit f, mitochondrial [Rhineura floridana]
MQDSDIPQTRPAFYTCPSCRPKRGRPSSCEPSRACAAFSQQPLRSRAESSFGSFKMADRPVPIKDMRLLDVKVGQLPTWLTTRDYSPTGIVRSCQGGYDRFFKKYIDVRKGGIGGIAMMLTSYVIISYIWNYKHLKHDRWRKYH